MMPLNRTLALALICSMLLALQSAANDEDDADAAELFVRQPRTFGYFIGDTLTQYVLLEAADEALELREWPPAQRVGVWFERRPARVEVDPQNGRRWLVLEHQIINAPREPTLIDLSGLRLEDAVGRGWIVPRWTIRVVPLTTEPADLRQVPRTLRPDHEAPRIPTWQIERRLLVYAGVAVAIALCWLAWAIWRNRRARQHEPFARAWEELRGLRDEMPEAWRTMHRAFDRVAGRVIQRTTIPTLIDAAPYLAAYRPRIEQFYMQSNELFFGRGLPADALSVRELCRDLRRLERRYQRWWT